MDQTILDKIRALLKNLGYEKIYWCEAIIYAVYQQIRITSAALNMDKPHKLLLGYRSKNIKICTLKFASYLHMHKSICISKLTVHAKVRIYV